jgi:ferrous iron transport protein B
MELPAYHAPVPSNTLRATWERGWDFIKRAGTVIFAASVIIWTLNSLSFEGGFHYITETNGGRSILELLGSGIAWLFKPLGFGTWQAAIATILGLLAKEEVVGVFGTLANMDDLLGSVEAGDAAAAITAGKMFFSSALAGFSFLVFNLLCAPCFAAMGAIKREMNSAKWTAFAIGYMCVFAYATGLVVYQIGLAAAGALNPIGVVAAVAVLGFVGYMLFVKKYQEADRLLVE